MQADWAHFPDVIVGGRARSLTAFKMVLSHSRKDAIVAGHSEAFRRLGGVPATVRIDNEKTAVVRGAGIYNTACPHQALDNRAPMAVWRDGITGALGERASN